MTEQCYLPADANSDGDNDGSDDGGDDVIVRLMIRVPMKVLNYGKTPPLPLVVMDLSD